jgi:colanic acid biosynthesis glycosyl transferase WcaI
MGVSHDFDAIMDAAARLKTEAGIRFVFIGGGSRRSEIERGMQARSLENVLLLPFQPMERLAESMSLGDVHLVSLRRGFEGLVVPSKAYGAMAAGRPLIYLGAPEGEIARMILETRSGSVIADTSDGKELARVLREYFTDPERRTREGSNALHASKNEYSRSTALSAYIDLFSALG